MFDLLRLARAARSFGFLVGFGRNAGFRAFAVVLTVLGIGIAVAGPVYGLVLAVPVGAVVYAFRRSRRADSRSYGFHRA